VKKTQAEYWAPRINAEWRKSVEGILGVGRQLIAAKEACEHGEFLRMFKGHDNVVSEPVPFGADAAQQLMKVASHSVISNTEFVRHLPQSWGTLYELTKLDDGQIVAGIEAGEITPTMTRTQAANLRADPIDYTLANWSQAATDAVGIVRLPRWIAAIAGWVDHDSYRFTLGAVSIECDGANATIVATDGRRMAVVTAPQSEDAAARLQAVPPFLVPADQLSKAIKQLPSRWKPGTRLAEANSDGNEHFVTIQAHGDGTATVAAADGSGSPVKIALCCNGRFPDWRAAVDFQAKDNQTVSNLRCNPNMLADVAFLARAAKAHSVTVRFNNRPALVGEFKTIDGCKGVTLVMGQAALESDQWVEAERTRIDTVRHYASRKRKAMKTAV